MICKEEGKKKKKKKKGCVLSCYFIRHDDSFIKFYCITIPRLYNHSYILLPQLELEVELRQIQHWNKMQFATIDGRET